MEHDAAGWTTKVVRSDGTTERVAYDEDGELVEASNDEIEVKLERDAPGRAVKEQQGDHGALGLRQALERSAMGDVTRHGAK